MKTIISKLLILALLASSAVFIGTSYSQDKNPPKKNEHVQERKRDRKKDNSCTKKHKHKKKKSKKGNNHKGNGNKGNKRKGR